MLHVTFFRVINGWEEEHVFHSDIHKCEEASNGDREEGEKKKKKKAKKEEEGEEEEEETHLHE